MGATGEVVDDRAFQEFGARLRGQLLRPADSGYDVARRVFNGMIDRRPALLVRCAGAADVIRSVEFARTHDLLLSVRRRAQRGGHGGLRRRPDARPLRHEGHPG